MKRLRPGLLVCLMARVVVGLTGCGEKATDDPSSPASTTASNSNSAPPDEEATKSGSSLNEKLGSYDGLCSWATPADLEAIFGPIDAVGFKECRLMAADDGGSGPMYHVMLDQQVGSTSSRRD